MKTVATNKRAKLDYDILETFISGIKLVGPEVKSIKAGHIQLKGSYVTIQNGEAMLLNAHIAPYKYANVDLDPNRTRKLLVHKSEINKMVTAREQGLTIIPISTGLEHGLVKIKVAIARGRKKIDKREYIKRREAERQIKRIR